MINTFITVSLIFGLMILIVTFFGLVFYISRNSRIKMEQIFLNSILNKK